MTGKRKYRLGREPRSRRAYTKAELAMVEALYGRKSVKEIAIRLKRSQSGISGLVIRLDLARARQLSLAERAYRVVEEVERKRAIHARRIERCALAQWLERHEYNQWYHARHRPTKRVGPDWLARLFGDPLE